MPKTAIEIIIALTLTVVVVILTRARRRVYPRHRGFELLLGGMFLVTAAAWMDSAEIQDRFADHPDLRDALLYIELILGYLLGVVLVGIGLSLWVPALVRFQEENSRRIAAELMLRLHFENTPLGVITWNKHFRIKGWNPAAERIFGYSVEEAIGRQLKNLIPELGLESEAPSHQRLRDAESVVTDTIKTRHKDGSIVVCDWYSIRLVDAEGELIGYASSVQDISEWLEAEREYKDEHELLKRLVDAAPGIFYMFDENHHMVRWNRAYEIALGRSADQIQQQDAILDVVTKADIPDALAEVEHAYKTGKGAVQIRVEHSSGKATPYLATGATIERDGNRYVAGIAVDISELKETEAELVHSKETLERRNASLELLNDLADRLHRTHDPDLIAKETISALVSHRDPPMVAFYILEENGEYLRLLADNGFDADTKRLGQRLPVKGSLSGIAVNEQYVAISEDIAEDDRLESAVRNKLIEQGFQVGISIPLMADEKCLGTINLVYSHSLDLHLLDRGAWQSVGHTVALAMINAQHQKQMEHQTLHDPLTTLGNRELLHRNCQDRIIEARDKNERLAIMLVDIDRFQEFNDALGHHTGDEILRMIGPRLISALKDKQAPVCRLGGDEFAVLISLQSSDGDGIAQAQELLEALRAPFQVGGMALELSASIGIARYPEHADDSHQLLRCADVAMHHAKKTSGTISAYQADKDRHTPERLALMVDLGPAIRGDEMVLFYQPKISLPDQTLQGFEALVRWQHPELGLLPPGRFVPLVETSELIHALTLKVLDLSLAQASIWHEQKLEASIAVNLSARNLMDKKLVSSIRRLLKQHAIAPELLDLEITETTLMLEPEHARQQLEQIAELGVKLTIDDFGTGYSSLAYLKRLPVQSLKVDRTFVMDMLDDVQDRVIVQSTINMAHSLGLSVVAEGVENQETLEQLASLNCDHAQGYHIARPMPAEGISEWLGQWTEQQADRVVINPAI